MQFFNFRQRFIAGMLRAIFGNINFFQVGSSRDCIDGPKAETRRDSGEGFLTWF